MILITGASGKTSRALIQRLSKIEGVCAFVRREEQASILKSLGAAKVIVGDMRDPSALQASMQGASRVYHICPNMSPDEVEIGRLVIEQARKAGVTHFVYHSVMHPQIEKMPHHWDKLRVEEMALESRLPFTILQPAPYMQNLLAAWKSIVQDDIWRIPYSVNAKFSFVDLEDIAAAATIVLTESDHLNATYELAGTLPTSHLEVAQVFGRGLNRSVRVEEEELADWRHRAAGLGEYALENLAKMFEYYDRWGLIGNPKTLGWLLRREPTSLEAFVERSIAEY